MRLVESTYNLETLRNIGQFFFLQNINLFFNSFFLFYVFVFVLCHLKTLRLENLQILDNFSESLFESFISINSLRLCLYTFPFLDFGTLRCEKL